jgi:hypothetical protein
MIIAIATTVNCKNRGLRTTSKTKNKTGSRRENQKLQQHQSQKINNNNRKTIKIKSYSY